MSSDDRTGWVAVVGERLDNCSEIRFGVDSLEEEGGLRVKNIQNCRFRIVNSSQDCRLNRLL